MQFNGTLFADHEKNASALNLFRMIISLNYGTFHKGRLKLLRGQALLFHMHSSNTSEMDNVIIADFIIPWNCFFKLKVVYSRYVLEVPVSKIIPQNSDTRVKKYVVIIVMYEISITCNYFL